MFVNIQFFLIIERHSFKNRSNHALIETISNKCCRHSQHRLKILKRFSGMEFLFCACFSHANKHAKELCSRKVNIVIKNITFDMHTFDIDSVCDLLLDTRALTLFNWRYKFFSSVYRIQIVHSLRLSFQLPLQMMKGIKRNRDGQLQKIVILWLLWQS